MKIKLSYHFYLLKNNKYLNMDKKEYIYKILLLGDSQVGKSCILTRYIDNSFKENHLSTFGLDYKMKDVQLDDGKNVKVQIWDTAGQDRFRSVTRNYFKGANGIILIYDITFKETFENVRNWIKQIKEEVSEKVCIILVGNKIDKGEERVITKEEGEKMANEYNLKFFECSAKTGDNIDKIFKEVVTKTVENFSKVDKKDSKKLKNQNKKKGCC